MAQKTLKEPEQVLFAAEDPVIRAETLLQSGEIKRIKDDFSAALIFYKEALDLFEKAGNIDGVARASNKTASIFYMQGNYPRAFEFYHKALKIFEDSGDKTGMANMLNNIAVLHRLQGNVKVSIGFLEKAIHYYEDVGAQKELASSYNNIGISYNDLGNYSLALEFVQKGLNLWEKLGNKQGIAFSYNNIGLCRYGQGNFDLALQYNEKALLVWKELGLKDSMIITYLYFGEIYKKLESYVLASEYLEMALDFSKEIGYKDGQKNSLKILYEVNKAAGDATTALQYYEQYVTLKDELSNAETSEKIANMKVNYELELNEKERKLIEKVLFNILPPAIAGRIKNGEEKIIERFENVSVLFADIVGFTAWSRNKEVQKIAEVLNTLFQIFDELAEQNKVEKIKTIGDAYMCVAGLPELCDDHTLRIANLALSMHEQVIAVFKGEIQLRIGMHSGEVIAGVLGKNKYAYDLWGDTVNTASRMESHGLAGEIHVSDEFKNQLTKAFDRLPEPDTKPGSRFHFDVRGEIEVKGKGKMTTWFLREKK